MPSYYIRDHAQTFSSLSLVLYLHYLIGTYLVLCTTVTYPMVFPKEEEMEETSDYMVKTYCSLGT